MGIAGFAVFWDGQTQLFAVEGGIGAVVSLILLLSAIAFPRAFESGGSEAVNETTTEDSHQMVGWGDRIRRSSVRDVRWRQVVSIRASRAGEA